MLLAKRLERGKFVWPQATSGVVSLTPAMLSMLLEGIDWRMPAWTARPETAMQRDADSELLGGISLARSGQ
ncbi:IS66 family insertion sequence element accessory protein TnpB [Belnapia arida]